MKKIKIIFLYSLFVTIEVYLETRTIFEARAWANLQPHPECGKVIKKWAVLNNLAIPCWLEL